MSGKVVQALNMGKKDYQGIHEANVEYEPLIVSDKAVHKSIVIESSSSRKLIIMQIFLVHSKTRFPIIAMQMNFVQ